MKNKLAFAVISIGMLILAGCGFTQESSGSDGINAPSNLQAFAGDGRVILTWTRSSSSQVTSYLIYRESASSANSQIASTGNVATYTDTTATNSVTYTYRIKATDGTSESSFSNTAEATPTASTGGLAAPSGLATSDGHLRTTLTWNPNTESDLTGYRVFRKASTASSFSQVATQSTRTYVDDYVAGDAGVTYEYVIRAYSATASSNASSQVSSIVRNGQTHHNNTCIPCHSGGANSQTSAGQSLSYWDTTITRMAGKGGSTVSTLSSEDRNALLDYMFRLNNSAL